MFYVKSTGPKFKNLHMENIENVNMEDFKNLHMEDI